MKTKIRFSEGSRSIGITTGSISGLFPFRDLGAISFESTLERDFLVRLSTFENIAEIYSQPVTIEYKAENGQTYPYTPDYLVKYKGYPWPEKRPHIIEVKPRNKLISALKKNRVKYSSIFQFCRENDYVFHFMTEDKIRDQRFINANFLRRYIDWEFDSEDIEWVLQSLKQYTTTTFEYLLSKHFFCDERRAIGIGLIWHLISIGKIECDLDQPLSFKTEICDGSSNE